MVAGAIGDFDDFFCAEGAQADTGDAGRVVAVHESPTTVVLAVGGGQGDVVRVVPRNGAVRGVEHGFSLFAESPSTFGVLRKYRYDAQQTPRWNAIYGHLTIKAAGNDVVKLVVFAGRDVNFRGGIAFDC